MGFQDLVRRAIAPFLGRDGREKIFQERLTGPLAASVESALTDAVRYRSGVSEEDRLASLHRLLANPQTQKIAQALIGRVRSNGADTLLMDAVERSDEIFSLVLPFSDAAAVNARGVDALTLAASGINPARKVKALLDAGASASAVNRTRETAPIPASGIFAKHFEPQPRCALGAAAVVLFFDYRKEFLAASTPREWPRSEAFWLIFDALDNDPEQARRVAPVALADLAGIFAFAQTGRKRSMRPRDFAKYSFFQTQAGFDKLLAEFPWQAISRWMSPEQSPAFLADKDPDPANEAVAAQFRAKFMAEFERMEMAKTMGHAANLNLAGMLGRSAGEPNSLGAQNGSVEPELSMAIGRMKAPRRI